MSSLFCPVSDMLNSLRGIIASMFNHSPQPNVMFTRVAPRDTETNQYPKLIFTTIKSIKKGDELYICYSADESKLWFSPDYKAEAGHADEKADEPTWIPPMVDDDNEGGNESSKEEDPVSAPNGASTDVAPVPTVRLQEDLGSVDTEDKKYLERKARKQSKREKKVKKPKEEGDKKNEVVASLEDKSSESSVKDSELPADPDATSSLSPSDYAAALAKLTLIPDIGIQNDDVEREERLAAMEAASAQNGEDRHNEVAWKLVKRIRGPVEAQEEDETRTGEFWDIAVQFCLFLLLHVTVEIWAVAILDKKLMPSILKYVPLVNISIHCSPAGLGI